MFENIIKLFKKTSKRETLNPSSRETAKERLHLVLMQDRANVSADFLDLMRQEIIEVIKKYIDIDESAMDVRLTNQANDDGTQGAPALYANIPILNIKEDVKEIKELRENSNNLDGEDKKKIEDENTKEKLEEKEMNEEKGKKEENTEDESNADELRDTENDNEGKNLEIKKTNIENVENDESAKSEDKINKKES